jgi:hypothetical protein
VKRIYTILLSLGLIFGISFGLSSVTQAANTTAKTYKNCTELNKDYKGGVAQKAGVKNKGGKTKFTPFVSKELYNANKGKDRDKDLIACER